MQDARCQDAPLSQWARTRIRGRPHARPLVIAPGMSAFKCRRVRGAFVLDPLHGLVFLRWSLALDLNGLILDGLGGFINALVIGVMLLPPLRRV